MGQSIRQAAATVVDIDKELTHAAARHRDEPAGKLAGAVGDVADQPPLIILSLATLGLGLALRRGALAKGGGRMLAAHLTATAARGVVKNLVDRARPAHALETGDERFEPGEGADDKELNSFPSGHVAGAVAVARAASRELPVAVPATAATALIAAAQPASGRHYLIDMVAGALIGWASEAVTDAAFNRLAPRLERWSANWQTSPDAVSTGEA